MQRAGGAEGAAGAEACEPVAEGDVALAVDAGAQAVEGPGDGGHLQCRAGLHVEAAGVQAAAAEARRAAGLDAHLAVVVEGAREAVAGAAGQLHRRAGGDAGGATAAGGAFQPQRAGVDQQAAVLLHRAGEHLRAGAVLLPLAPVVHGRRKGAAGRRGEAVARQVAEAAVAADVAGALPGGQASVLGAGVQRACRQLEQALVEQRGGRDAPAHQRVAAGAVHLQHQAHLVRAAFLEKHARRVGRTDGAGLFHLQQAARQHGLRRASVAIGHLQEPGDVAAAVQAQAAAVVGVAGLQLAAHHHRPLVVQAPAQQGDTAVGGDVEVGPVLQAVGGFEVGQQLHLPLVAQPAAEQRRRRPQHREQPLVLQLAGDVAVVEDDLQHIEVAAVLVQAAAGQDAQLARLQRAAMQLQLPHAVHRRRCAGLQHQVGMAAQVQRAGVDGGAVDRGGAQPRAETAAGVEPQAAGPQRAAQQLVAGGLAVPCQRDFTRDGDLARMLHEAGLPGDAQHQMAVDAQVRAAVDLVAPAATAAGAQRQVGADAHPAAVVQEHAAAIGAHGHRATDFQHRGDGVGPLQRHRACGTGMAPEHRVTLHPVRRATAARCLHGVQVQAALAGDAHLQPAVHADRGAGVELAAATGAGQRAHDEVAPQSQRGALAHAQHTRAARAHHHARRLTGQLREGQIQPALAAGRLAQHGVATHRHAGGLAHGQRAAALPTDHQATLDRHRVDAHLPGAVALGGAAHGDAAVHMHAARAGLRQHGAAVVADHQVAAQQGAAAAGQGHQRAGAGLLAKDRLAVHLHHAAAGPDALAGVADDPVAGDDQLRQAGGRIQAFALLADHQRTAHGHAAAREVAEHALALLADHQVAGDSQRAAAQHRQ